MRNKTRKFIWSAPLVAALAIIGALTLAGVLLMPNADNAEAQAAAPGVPQTVTVAPGNTEVVVTWAAPADDGGQTPTYQVRYAQAATAPTADAGWTVHSTQDGIRRRVITGLDNGTAVFVQVRAVNSGGMSDWADGAASATPVPGAPGAPMNVMVSQTAVVSGTPDTANVLISWDAPENDGGADITGYVVEVSPDTGVTLTQPSGAATTTTATGLAIGTPYTFTVVANNSNADYSAGGTPGARGGSGNFTPTSSVSLSTLSFNGAVSDIDSTSGGAGINITIRVNDLTADVPPGSSIVLILEDDYQVPSSIPANSVIFQGTGANAGTGYNTGAVPASVSPEVKTGAYVDADKKDYAIRIRVPDFCSGDNTCGLDDGQDLAVVVTSAAGIKNPTEAGTHSTYVDVIGPVDELKGSSTIRGLTKANFMTEAKISLSSVDGGRGDELTVTGSGFNNGTSAAAYVKQADSKPVCDVAFRAGATQLETGTVGSDDKVAVTFEVTVPTFKPGNVNWICMVDGEGRWSTNDAEDFSLDPSIRVSPKTANVGDTVTLFAQDFPSGAAAAAAAEPIELAGQEISSTSGNIGADGSGTATFVVPGWAEGTLRVDAWGENTKLTVIGSSLNISKSEALPNESLTISGDGFSTASDNYVSPASITLAGVPLEVHDDSVDNGQVDVSSSGQFVATVVLWPASGTDNPALTAGTHTIEVTDSQGFSGSATIIIPEPTIEVMPGVAGPRDTVTISGENWPVDNLEGANTAAVSISVDDGGQDRQYSVYPDGAGRFFVEHTVHSRVTIPSTSRVTANYADEVVKLTEYEIPEAVIEVTPGEGQPGDAVSLTVEKMPVYASVDRIQIAGRDVLPVGNFSTDGDGSVTVDGVVIPGLDPGTYSVLLDVDDTVAIGSVDVLAEVVGTDTPVAEGLADLGDNLSAAFYFDNISKTWSFYDPRPEFADLNTLDSLINGEAYWVLVSSDVDDAVLNNKTRSLTCSGGDCWNLVIW